MNTQSVLRALCLFGLVLMLPLGVFASHVMAQEPVSSPPYSPPSAKPASTRISRTPLIFIPGIMGSRLFNTVDYDEQELWADFTHILLSDLDMLQLASDGVSPASDDPSYTTVHTKTGTAGTVANIQVAFYDYKVYQDFYDHFLQAPPTGLGYTEGVDFWAFPYDWRKDNRLAADALDTLVDQIMAQTGQGQVYVVAHSMGGLVARQYIADPARAAKVKRLVTLGTPYLGTPKALYVLLEGDCVLNVLDLACLPSMKECQKIVVNHPGFYELFASRSYFDVKGGGYYGMSDTPDPSGACSQCLSYTQTYTTAVVTKLNTGIMDSSDAFHQAIDTMGNWATPWNGVPVDTVAGIGQQTMVGIRKQIKWPCGCPWCICQHVPIYGTQGDGTVALYSASMANPATGTNLRGTATYTTFVGDHTGLTKMPAVWQYIEQRLGLTTTTTSQIAPLATHDSSAFTGAQIIAFGATAIEAHDAAGQYTGPVSDTELIRIAIPGSAYHHQEGLASLALRGGQVYTITVIPSGNSMVDLALLQTSVSGTVTTTLHTSISVTAQARIHMLGDPYQADTWHADVNGDGTIDASHPPTLVYAPGVARDTQPPTVTVHIQGAPGPQGWYTMPVTVTLVATDNAAISRVEYAFSGDRRPRLYTGPFVADPAQVSVLYAAATDQSGNMNVPVQVRIGPERTWLPIVFKQ
jgi:pimeloyl-ACP methyl ester carboxylesterase